MPIQTRYEQQDERADPVREGRFGRLGDANDAVADTRTTMHAEGDDERTDTVRYRVDAGAVAAAIVDRLLAGRTLRPPAARRCPGSGH